jgi:hypothetical protein
MSTHFTAGASTMAEKNPTKTVNVCFILMMFNLIMPYYLGEARGIYICHCQAYCYTVLPLIDW